MQEMQNIRDLSSCWYFIAVIGLLALITYAFAKMKPYSIHFGLLATCLIGRRILLYVPIPGSISDPDHLLIWNYSAFVTSSVVFISVVIVIFLLNIGLRQSENEDNGNGWCLGLIIIGLILMFWKTVLGLLLWSPLAVIKLLFVNPLFLPMSYFLFLFNFTSALRIPVFFKKWRLIFLLGPPSLGIILLFFSKLNHRICTSSSPNLESVFTQIDSTEISSIGYFSKDPFHNKVNSFLETAWEKVPEITQSEINITEKNVPDGYTLPAKPTEEVFHNGLKEIGRFFVNHLDIWSPKRLSPRIILLTILLVLFSLAVLPRLFLKK